ncbi:MAG: DUF4912 domain-containing protein [Chthoniobacterales bacterium]
MPPDSPASDAPIADENENPFRVSAAPVIPARNGSNREKGEFELPRSYGVETLWLLPRDPHSLFAYWDIDWKAAFGEESPRARKVHLLVLAEDDSEDAKIEVEPLAGYCIIRVQQADTAYRAELGFADATGAWQVAGRSELVAVPAEAEGRLEPGNFATVPLHLSFQRMLNATRDNMETNHSLTSTLSQLRQRAAAAPADESMSAQQREIIRAIEEAAARHPAPPIPSTPTPDLWAHHRLERIFGFGNSSLNDGFGGSSRGA